MQGKTFFRIWTALLAAALLAGCGSERTDNMRLLYWNIQNGMWSDQGNNYDNFVAWVREYDPDRTTKRVPPKKWTLRIVT